MALERYRQKRDFSITPEPEGTVRKGRARALGFLVQKHAASRLHYDFRLELNGVLLSWAVPKGPSLDPNDKRLAMHVEDHPIEYGDFEGVIPKKQYGGGTVMLWDRGEWVPKSDPNVAYKTGKLKFELKGEKLKGVWNLVRSRGGPHGGENAWLLFKEADEFARLGADALVVDDQPDSVASARTLEQIAADADRVWHSDKTVAANVKGGAVPKKKKRNKLDAIAIAGAMKAAQPASIEPQLATLVKLPPEGRGWIHEIKYDGYRMLCRIENGDARMMSRKLKDWTDDFLPIAKTAARLPLQSAWLDGEVVIMDDEGRSSFQTLQNVLADASSSRLVYMVFDLLYLDGFDLRLVPLIERKRLLEKILADAPPNLRYSEHFAASGADFLQSIAKLGLEGMVSKRGDLPFQPGRGTAWLKTKFLKRQEMVIGGYTDPGGSRQGFGALLLGVYEPDGRLAYAGKVGTGFNDAALATLTKRLAVLVRRESPFHNPLRGAEARNAHWVEPTLVAEISFTEWTSEGTLRHASFQGLREDKPARDVVREIALPGDAAAAAQPGNAAAAALAPAPPSVDRDGRAGNVPAALRKPGKPASRKGSAASADIVAGIVLSNPDKILYPEAKLCKRDLALYYEAVGDWILPHLRQRPLTLVRCPNGWTRECFYQKNADSSTSEVISRVRIDGSDGKVSMYMMANSVPAIVAILQMGALELHPWGSRSPKLAFPDRLVFDLDPDENLDWKTLTEAVLLVKTLLENIGLKTFLKTTGGKGLHVVVPIEPTVAWEDAKGFTKAVAELLEQTFPDRFTSKLLKVSRHGKIFIDYLRNGEGATAVAAYSIRAKANAPVSTPVAWKELAKDLRFDHFTVRNVVARLSRMKRDPWAELDGSRQRLGASVMAKVGYRASAGRKQVKG